MKGMTISRATTIEALVRAGDVTVHYVNVGHNLVYVEANGDGSIVTVTQHTHDEVHVGGVTFVGFFMPTPQWFADALAAGDFQSEQMRAWGRQDDHRRALEIAAERDPEGLDADAADRWW